MKHAFLVFGWIFSLVLLLGGTAGHAETGAAVAIKLSRMMTETASDEAALAGALLDGKDRAVFCAVCHGKNGISRRNWVPNMAGQNRDYLLEQILAYANGNRKHRVMNDLSRAFTDRDIVNLTLYYASMPVEQGSVTVDPEQIRNGRAKYNSHCLSCHGEDGRGAEAYVWIAGQKAEYVEKALKRYKSGEGGRINARMRGVTVRLSEQDFADLALYVSSLR